MPVVPRKSSPDLIWPFPVRQAVPVPSSAFTLRRITVLSGGVGGARFVQGLLHGLRSGVVAGGSADTEVTVVANTADDWWVHGLKVCLTCEVRDECLESALMNDERFGIWGGLSERERRKLKKRAV